MHKLLKTYQAFGTIEKRVELWDVFYDLYVEFFGENSKEAVKFKKVLEDEKALLG